MPHLQHLIPEAGKIIRRDWGKQVVERLEEAHRTYLGYMPTRVLTDFVPEPDLALKLGLEKFKWHWVYAGYGYFIYSVHTPLVATGELSFSETSCAKCGRGFKQGDALALSVVSVNERTVVKPIHLAE